MSDRNPLQWIERVKELTMQLVDCDHYALFLFGSRARDPANDYGDIDVGILGNEPLSEGLHAQLEAAIESSDIPLKVDFIDFKVAEKSFKSLALQKIVIWNKPNSIDIV